MVIYTYTLTENNEVKRVINGLVTLDEVRILDQQGNERDFVIKNETVPFELHLTNPAYQIRFMKGLGSY